MAEAPRIAPIAPGAVRRIAGAQVVPDMRAAVKELIENALDAGATSIGTCVAPDAELRFKEYGLGGIEVVDNGSGIRKEDYSMIGRRHHTSKLTSFDDLARVATFGFRGEALASLCSVAHVTLLTATERDAPMGTLLELAHDGSLKACDKRIARQRGTTVTLSQLLAPLPVRRRELEKNVKREFAKAQAIIQAYALVCEGVRWASSVLLPDGRRVSQLIVRAATGPQYLGANMTALFGPKAAATVQPLQLDLGEDGVRMVGLVSKPALGSGRSSGDRQYFYLNGRPWDCPKLAHIFNQVYHTFNAMQYPCVVADLRLGRHAYDVNVSPDKRTLYLHEEAALFERIRVALEQVWEPTRGVLRVQNQAFESLAPADEAPKRNAPEASREPTKTPRLEEPTVSTWSASWSSPPSSQESNATQGVSSMRAQFRQAVRNFAVRRAQAPDYVSEHEEDTSMGADEDASSIEASDGASSEDELQGTSRSSSACPSASVAPRDTLRRPSSPIVPAPAEPVPTLAPAEPVPREEPRHETQTSSPRALAPPTSEPVLVQEECAAPRKDTVEATPTLPSSVQPTVRSQRKSVTPTPASLEASESLDAAPCSPDASRNTARSRWTEPRSPAALPDTTLTLPFHLPDFYGRLEHVPGPSAPRVWQGAEVGVPDEQVVAALERVLCKSDFAHMRVVGQFNLGFIIARRVTHDMDDLFIIDQHAADEKFNFETLQRTTKIHSQQLLRPEPIELAPTDELVAMEHAAWLRMNGFDIQMDEEAPPGHRVKLLSKPVSKDTVFDLHGACLLLMLDLEELLYQLREAHHGLECRVRCSKVHDMLASRSCRKSIMVGSALDLRQMRQVVEHMGETEQPWNCPHGRPTIRHLTTLGTPPSARPVAWSALSLL
ncbi:ATP-binding mismatch repair protein [Malassezia nana]|uniref:ATP-binding mismatch repair protein n=1 Tax=Malassezia nana TaxID=180528 RepID=A0AAF0ELR3_9BASI|nr:ATP-binding mismatch repair protein [Malassezia nana]